MLNKKKGVGQISSFAIENSLNPVAMKGLRDLGILNSQGGNCPAPQKEIDVLVLEFFSHEYTKFFLLFLNHQTRTFFQKLMQSNHLLMPQTLPHISNEVKG